jgi:hypothetical protein
MAPYLCAHDNRLFEEKDRLAGGEWASMDLWE